MCFFLANILTLRDVVWRVAVLWRTMCHNICFLRRDWFSGRHRIQKTKQTNHCWCFLAFSLGKVGSCWSWYWISQ
uniref:Putative secreted protein n=1 Tax=Anopheles darlingi TaxID=43151 RepID=A0A2M4DKJ6_ANODA